MCRSPKDFFKKTSQGRSQRSNEGKPVHTLDHAVLSTEEDSGDDFYHLAFDESVHAMPSAASKLFTMLYLSVSGDSFTDVKFQVRSAATCNTLPYQPLQEDWQGCVFAINICKADFILWRIDSSVGQGDPCSSNPAVLHADAFSGGRFTVQAGIAGAT